MTAHYSILKSNPEESKLRWMLLLSFIIHLVVIISFVGKPPDSSKKVYFSPAYSVSLVEMPPASTALKRQGISGDHKVSLWEGPSAVSYQIKAPRKRTHTTLTISKKDGLKDTAPSVKTEGGEALTRGSDTSAHGRAGQPSEGNSHTTASGGKLPYGVGVQAAGFPNLRFSRYYQAIWSKIKKAWILPDYGGHRENLEAIVVIKINKYGKILKIDFEKKSGDSNLDRSVLRAIKKADPLPPLPADYRGNFLEVGIRFLPEEETL